MSTSSNAARAILPLLVLIGAVAGAYAIIASKPQPEKKPRDRRGLLVETRTVSRGPQQVVVEAQGTVVAGYSVVLSPEISGRVVWKNPELTTGGQVKKGEVLVKLDPSDYRIDIDQQAAAVARAESDVELEQGRKNVAEAEWKMFGSGDSGGSKIAQRDPQMRAARLGLTTAEQGLSRAKLRLNRTILRAPYDAIVRENSTEVGRMVGAGQPLATLIDSSLFTVVASLPMEDLQWLKVPGTNAPLMSVAQMTEAYESEDPTASFTAMTTIARVSQKVGDGEIIRTGVITRILGDLDPVGRMARLLVTVDDPLGLRQPATAGVAALPLLLGAYVNVQLAGSTVDDVVVLPRSALRDGNRVYVMTAKGKLDIREVTVKRRQGTRVMITEGLTDGERIITSAMPSAVQGMDLREVSTAQPDARVQGGEGTEGKRAVDSGQRAPAEQRAPEATDG